eukprot:TRINITY_DN1505_c0_g1_i1.p1 TRINITY_DN1505_c0_g1~~TRINITY_DN1505_c0_g1_i1.p1  ORF type:complete len:541 (-),score=38.34 TRINITY_DN1505_c0_g1_i1:910-2532(-)
MALDSAAKHVLCATPLALLRLYPSINNSATNAHDVDIFLMQALADSAALHVLSYNGIWCIVLTPAACTHKVRLVYQNVPRRTRNSRGLHHFSVKPPLGGYGGYETSADAGGADGDGDGGDVGSGDGNGDVCDPRREQAADSSDQAAAPHIRQRPAAHAANTKGHQRTLLDTDYRRWTRNMLPCSSETRACRAWDGAASEIPLPAAVKAGMYEFKCFRCGATAGDLGEAAMADLHTLSGLNKIRTRASLCPNVACGETVRFEASDHGLFAYNAETVHACMLHNVILFTIISTKSSISEATAVSALNLFCSGAVHAKDSTKTRQELSYATDQYSRTLIVPRALFRCNDCYHCSQTPCAAVAADEQTIGIFQEAFFPFEMSTTNVPIIPISINDACAARDPKVRMCVRQRLKTGWSAEITFKKAEQKAMSSFASLSDVAPPLGVHRTSSTAKRPACGRPASSGARSLAAPLRRRAATTARSCRTRRGPGLTPPHNHTALISRRAHPPSLALGRQLCSKGNAEVASRKTWTARRSPPLAFAVAR